MKYKVLAYITAYQDIYSVEQCIKAINNQSYTIDNIYVVDNSKEQLKSSLFLQTNVIYKHLPNNVGIASGVKIALDWALSNKYDFLWTFDQDSEPEPNALKELLLNYEEISQKGKTIGIIAPLVIDKTSDQELYGAIFYQYKFIPAFYIQNYRSFFHKKIYECDNVITSGSLVSLQAAKNVDMPNEGLFIDAVDWDYCMKFRAKGYSIVVCTDAILKHNFGTYNYQSNKNKLSTNPIYCYSALRYYYMCRNHTYIETRLSKQNNYLHISIIYRIYSLIKKIAKVILYEQEQKILKIWACVRGTYDGFIGKLGKTW